MGREEKKEGDDRYDKYNKPEPHITLPTMTRNEKLNVLQDLITEIVNAPSEDGLKILNTLYEEQSLSLKTQWVILYKIAKALPESQKTKYYNVFLKHHLLSEIKKYLQDKAIMLWNKMYKIYIVLNDKGPLDPKNLPPIYKLIETGKQKTEDHPEKIEQSSDVKTLLDIYHDLHIISDEIDEAAVNLAGQNVIVHHLE